MRHSRMRPQLVMPKASLLVAMSTPLTVSVWCVPLSDDLPLPPTCLFARLHAPRIIVWPACAPHCVARMQASGPPATSLALALALAAGPARPARPRLGVACVPSICADFPEPAVRARAFPACPPACGPSRLSLLSGAARFVSLAG
jgi:hypothetical protein